MSANVNYIIGVDVQVSGDESIAKIRADIEELANVSSNTANTINETTKYFENWSNQLAGILKGIQDISAASHSITASLQDQVTQANELHNSLQNVTAQAGEYKTALEVQNALLKENAELSAKTSGKRDAVTPTIGPVGDTAGLEAALVALEAVKKEYNEIGKAAEGAAKETKSLSAEVSKTADKNDNMELVFQKISQITQESLKLSERVTAGIQGIERTYSGITNAGEKVAATIRIVGDEVKAADLKTTNLKHTIEATPSIKLVAEKDLQLLKQQEDLTKRIADITSRMSSMKDFLKTDTVNANLQGVITKMTAVDEYGQKVSASFEKQGDLVTRITDNISSLAAAAGRNVAENERVKQSIEEQVKSLTEVEKITRRNPDGSKTFAIKGYDIDNMSKYVGQWTELNGKVIRAEETVTEFSRVVSSMRGVAEELNMTWQSIFRVGMIQLTHRAVSGLIGQLKLASKGAMELQQQIARIQTISKSDMGMESWMKRIQEVSNRTGAAIGDVANAVNEAISNQVADGMSAIQFVESAGKLAATTNINMATSVNLLSSALNSYGESAGKASEFAAQMFRTIDLGRLNVTTYADTMGRVTPLASQLGISFEEVNAFMATTTVKGNKTAASMTMLQNVMTAMLKPSKALEEQIRQLGFDSGAAMFKSLGLANAIDTLATSVGNSEVELAKMFGNVRALQGVLSVTGEQSALYAENIRKMAISVEYYEKQALKVMTTPAAIIGQQQQKIKNYFTVDWGNWLLGWGAYANKLVEVNTLIKIGTPLLVSFLSLVAVGKTATFFSTSSKDIGSFLKNLKLLRTDFPLVLEGVRGVSSAIGVNLVPVVKAARASVEFLSKALGGISLVGVAAGGGLLALKAIIDSVANDYVLQAERMNAALSMNKEIQEQVQKVETERLQKQLSGLKKEYSLVSQITAAYRRVASAQLGSDMKELIPDFNRLQVSIKNVTGQMTKDIENVNKAIDALETGIKDSVKAINDIEMRRTDQLFEWKLDDAEISDKFGVIEDRIAELNKQKITIAASLSREGISVRDFDAVIKSMVDVDDKIAGLEKAKADIARSNYKQIQSLLESNRRDQAEINKLESEDTNSRRTENLREQVELRNREIAQLKNFTDFEGLINESAKRQTTSQLELNKLRQRGIELGAKEAENTLQLSASLDLLNASLDEVKPTKIISVEDFDKAIKSIETLRTELNGLEGQGNDDFEERRKGALARLRAYEDQLNKSSDTVDFMRQIENARKIAEDRNKALQEVQADESLVKVKAWAQAQSAALQKLLDNGTGVFNPDSGNVELNKASIEALTRALRDGNVEIAKQFLDRAPEMRQETGRTAGLLERDATLGDMLNRLVPGLTNAVDNAVKIQGANDQKIAEAVEEQKRSLEVLEQIRDDAREKGVDIPKDDPQLTQVNNTLETLLTEATGAKYMQEVQTTFKAFTSSIRSLEDLQKEANRKAEDIEITKFAKGGWVPSSGSRDTVPALLTPGEFVVNKRAAQEYGRALQQINTSNRTMGDVNVTLNSSGGKADIAAVVHGMRTGHRRGLWRLDK